MKTLEVNINGAVRQLPIVQVGPDVSVALFNMLGDTEVVERSAEALIKLMPDDIDTLVTPEVKAVPLAHAMSRLTGKPYIVARKTEKPYMISPVSRSVISITTGKPQLLVIDGNDIKLLKGKKVAILDDVVSTGSTLKGLSELVEEVGGTVSVVMAVFTEGVPRGDVISLGHLPLYKPE